jgi:hypothetical protein
MSPPPIPRREDRHLIPFSSVVLKAELFTSSFCHVGYLWDVSASGACLCFSDNDDEAGNIHHKDFLHVRFLSPETESAITSPCRVAWLNSMHGARFVGVELTEAMDLSKTFFSNLLNPKFLNHLCPN